MKSPANPFDRLTQEEWDFRAITPEQLPYAIIYEYARSCPKVVEHFQAWHQKKLKFGDLDQKFSEEKRRSHQEHFAKEIQVAKSAKKHSSRKRRFAEGFLRSLNELGDKNENLFFLNCRSVEEVLRKAVDERLLLPPEIQSIIFDQLDVALSHSELLCFLNPLFPVPFLKSVDIDSRVSVLENLKPLVPKMPGFRALLQTHVLNKDHPHYYFSDRWNSKEFTESQTKLGIRKYEIILDLRNTKNQIKQEFGKWLDQLEDSGIKKFAVKKGKAVSLAWFKLKELAAFRLSNARYSYDQAQNLLDEIAVDNTDKASLSVLPIYSSQGGWSDAKARASRRIHELFTR